MNINLEKKIDDDVREASWHSVYGFVYNSIEDSIGDFVWGFVYDSFWDSLRSYDSLRGYDCLRKKTNEYEFRK